MLRRRAFWLSMRKFKNPQGASPAGFLLQRNIKLKHQAGIAEDIDLC